MVTARELTGANACAAGDRPRRGEALGSVLADHSQQSGPGGTPVRWPAGVWGWGSGQSADLAGERHQSLLGVRCANRDRAGARGFGHIARPTRRSRSSSRPPTQLRTTSITRSSATRCSGSRTTTCGTSRSSRLSTRASTRPGSTVIASSMPRSLSVLCRSVASCLAVRCSSPRTISCISLPSTSDQPCPMLRCSTSSMFHGPNRDT